MINDVYVSKEVNGNIYTNKLPCEIYNDHFENAKQYNIPKAQLIIADIPYLSLDVIESSDFLEFVKNEIFDFAEFNKANKIYEQLTLF